MCVQAMQGKSLNLGLHLMGGCHPVAILTQVRAEDANNMSVRKRCKVFEVSAIWQNINRSPSDALWTKWNNNSSNPLHRQRYGRPSIRIAITILGPIVQYSQIMSRRNEGAPQRHSFLQLFRHQRAKLINLLRRGP